MGEYTEQDAERASRILETLIRRERLWDEKFDEGLSVVDVQAHVNEFLNDLEILPAIGAYFPAMKVAGGPPSPVSLAWFLNPPWPPFAGWWGRWARFWGDEYNGPLSDAFRRSSDPVFVSLSPRQAQENFFIRARDFLATRLSALRRPGGPPGPPRKPLNIYRYRQGPPTTAGGCLFSVSTNSHGLRTYWTGAYYISPNFFDAPTTPVEEYLLAGTYIFGVNGGAYGSNVQWDTNAVCTLPGKTSVHLEY